MKFFIATGIALMSTAAVYATTVGAAPLSAARLTELSADGREIAPGYEKSLTVLGSSRQDPQSLILKEEIPSKDGAPVESQFVITKKSPAGCGSVKLEAREKTPGTVNRVIEVVDHTTRVCDDYQPYRWEMILKEEGREPRRLVAPSDDFLSIR